MCHDCRRLDALYRRYHVSREEEAQVDQIARWRVQAKMYERRKN